MAGLNLEAVRCEALFVSALQRGDSIPVFPETVRDAIHQAIRWFGVRGCAAQVAQEFGDHPDTAVMRMRWARHAVTQAFPGRLGGVHTSSPVVPPQRQAA